MMLDTRITTVMSFAIIAIFSASFWSQAKSPLKIEVKESVS